MTFYLIKWDAGFGENFEVIEAESAEKAIEGAYQAWRDEAESNADYGAETLTVDLCENYAFDPADYDL